MPADAVTATTPIILSPHATLKWQDSIQKPWQERWFSLGASRQATADPVTLFWGEVAATCIGTLCHVVNPDTPASDDAQLLADIPLPEDALTWIADAPPLPGGEYLNEATLHALWKQLLHWCAQGVTDAGGLALFLQNTAPRWQQVGRVFFHLAENRMDETRPFAFMATYTTGLNEQRQPRHVPLSHALQQYAGENNRPALIRLLEPVRRAAELLPWVQKMTTSGGIYQPVAWSADDAFLFLQSSPELETCGLGTRVPDWWKKRPRPVVNVTMDVQPASSLGVSGLLDFDITVAIGDTTLDAEELASLLEHKDGGLVLHKGQWVEMDRDKLQEALRHWQHIKADADAGQLNFFQGMRLLAGLPDDARTSAASDDEWRSWSLMQAGATFKELLTATRENSLSSCDNTPGLQATLRPYQAYGVSWLRFLSGLGLGACLADDMGLGKTMQILALLLQEKQAGHTTPSLLIVPASLLGNWQKEASAFAPNLRLLTVHASEMAATCISMTEQPQDLAGYDLVITTYGMCTRLTWLADFTWRRIIADEAQAIKNANTKQSRAVRKLRAESRIALTGTPIENSLSDLWALFDFLNPGLLGSMKSFAFCIKKMGQSPKRFAPLRLVTSPYILRRMKTDKSIINDLPDKTEMPLFCHLTKTQVRLYANVTKNLEKTLQELDHSPEAQGKRRVVVLQSLVLLKQICNHPAQAGMHGGSGAEYAPELSGKFQCLAELCANIATRQERTLIFTQFREIIEPVAQLLAGIFGSPGLVLHGGTTVRQRSSLVKTFQQPDGPPFFVLSLKAGGTGLTLTQANHVIHLDRWWNPAVEDQATDRAFRIGQKKNVLVHKCITRGTLEEKIDNLITQKRQLIDEVLGDGTELNITSLSDAEILDLVRLDIQQATD